MHNANNRVADLHEMFNVYNEQFFEGKLMTITILIQRSYATEGKYTYVAEKRGKNCSGWLPRRSELGKAHIVISEWCYDEDTVEGALLHEMVHQWQCEVLDRGASHDAIFCSKARRIERATGYELL